MDVSKEPLKALWIGTPTNPQSFYQDIEYETLPTYCMHCCVQGHNVRTCKWVGKKRDATHKLRKEGLKSYPTWVQKEQPSTQANGCLLGGESSKAMEILLGDH